MDDLLNRSRHRAMTVFPVEEAGINDLIAESVWSPRELRAEQ